MCEMIQFAEKQGNAKTALNEMDRKTAPKSAIEGLLRESPVRKSRVRKLLLLHHVWNYHGTPA